MRAQVGNYFICSGHCDWKEDKCAGVVGMGSGGNREREKRKERWRANEMRLLLTAKWK